MPATIAALYAAALLAALTLTGSASPVGPDEGRTARPTWEKVTAVPGTRSSPKGTHVIADIPNLTGRGNTAQMTYYERPSGAKVFAAGAFTLGGAHDPVECRLPENLWNHLGPPTREPVGASRPDACG